MLKSAEIWALGAMSGTSLDGVDAAMLRTDGITIGAFGACDYLERSAADRATVARALGQWQDGADVGAAAEVVETEHARLLGRFSGAEVIGFHGQTLAHDPHGRGTHQAGDGQLLAELLGVPVVWDFRSADVQLGGQGAPLAPFYHHACARHVGATHPLAFLNLGGVGNLTWVDPTVERPEDARALLAFDTGPANAPLDDLVQQRLGQTCDRGGALAATGAPDADVLERFLASSYFFKMPPKSLDRNDFAQLSREVGALSDADAAATLSHAVALSVLAGFDHFDRLPQQVLVTGGGRHNPLIMDLLADHLSCPVLPVEDVGLNGDMLEAQAFAFLAVRVMRGLPTSCPGTTGVGAAVGGGTISRPGGAMTVVAPDAPQHIGGA